MPSINATHSILVQMGLHQSVRIMMVVRVLMSILLCDDAHVVVCQVTGFSFSSFPAGSLLTSKNAVYNSTLRSYDMTSPHGAPLLNMSYDVGYYCGKVVYKEKVRMMEKASNKVPSFTTSFTFSFHGSSCRGFGMVFTFGASPNVSDGQAWSTMATGMCTYDIYNYDSAVSNRVLAVSFDSARSRFSSSAWADPSDSNIGVVVIRNGDTTGSIQYNLCGVDVVSCGFFCGERGNFSAWVDYDGVGRALEVRFRNGGLAGGGKPAEPVIRVPNLPLDEILDEEMYIGFASATYLYINNSDYLTETHRISAWNFNGSLAGISQPSPGRDAKSSQSGHIAGICAAIFGATLILGLLCFIKHRRTKKVKSAHRSSPTLTAVSDSRPYTFKELRTMTKNFSDSELLSSGAFGDVFKGTPPSGGSLLAVKRIKQDREHGQASFEAEAKSLKQIRHRNLLQLRGWCEAKEGLFLVYDFMCNGSLDKWLHPSPDSTHVQSLSWTVRRFILAGVASGLEYLHEEWVQCVLHRDIKSSNVLLDADFNPYLGDFGLARLVDHRKQQKTTMLAGTLGYMAPEMHFTGRATKETDVYAFGVLVLEVVSGRTPFLSATSHFGDQPGEFLLLERVWRAHEAGEISKMVDPKLLDSAATRIAFRDMENVLQVGLLCCLPNPTERPSMRVVNQLFQSSEAGEMAIPSLPATKPTLPGQRISMPHSSENTVHPTVQSSTDAARFSTQSST